MSAEEQAAALAEVVLTDAALREHETFEMSRRIAAVEAAAKFTRKTKNFDIDVTNLLRIASFLWDGLIPDLLPLAELEQPEHGARVAFTSTPSGAESGGAYL